MATTPRSIDRKQAAVIITLGALATGALALVIGPLFKFATADIVGFGSVEINGLDTPDGKLFLGVGIGLLILAAVVWIARSPVTRRVIGGIGTVGAAFMIVFAVFDLMRLEDDIPEALAADISIGAGVGLFIVLGGAIVATIGALLMLFGRLPAREQVEIPPPPPPAASSGARRESRPPTASDDSEPSVLPDPWP